MLHHFNDKSSFIIILFLCLILQHTACFGQDEEFKELLVTMKVNYEDSEEVADILVNSKNEVLITLEEIKKFNIQDSYLKSGLVTIKDVPYINTSALKGTKVILDQANLAIDIKFPTNTMLTQQLNAKVADVRTVNNAIRKAAKGAFLNYNFTLTKTNAQSNIAGNPVFQYFSKAGYFQSTFLASNHKIGGSKQNVVRLETNWTTDNVKNMARWRIGDSITKAASWSGSTRFAGLQYATNFAVRPDFVPFPLANFTGVANLPTTVDVYLNSLKIYQQQLKQGPFTINNLPVTTGNGNIVVETQDITGKRTTVVMPYSVAPTLLKRGLSNYSFEAGASRDQFAISSSKYRYLLTNADYLRGITDAWTTGVHFESMRKSASFGLVNTLMLGNFGLISGSVATNLPKPTNAQIYTLSYSYQNSAIGFNTSVSSIGREFIDSFTYPGIRTTRPKLQTSLTYNHDKFGQFFIGYSVAGTTGIKNKRLDFTYEKSIVANSVLRLSLGTDLAQKRSNTSCMLSLNTMLGEKNTNAGISNAYQSGIRTRNIELSDPVSKPIDWGYRILLQDSKTLYTKSKTNDFDLGVSGQNNIGSGSFRVYEYNKAASQQLTFNGSIVAINDAVFLAPTIQESLALVKVGTLPNIPIYYNNQTIGKTNTKGMTLAPNVAPYTPSQIRIEDGALPLDMSVPNISAIVAPPSGGGVVANFPVRMTKGVEMRIVDGEKNPLSINNEVKIEGIKEELYIGYNGVLYIENVANLKSLKGKVCSAKNECCILTAPLNLKIPDPVISIGDVICQSNQVKPKTLAEPSVEDSTNPSQKAVPTQPMQPGPDS